LVRAVDPFTRGQLRNRLKLTGNTSVHLRSFLDKPTPKGHTIKGSGKVAFRANRKNSNSLQLTLDLRRACERNLQICGQSPGDYDFGKARVLDKDSVVNLNGRR